MRLTMVSWGIILGAFVFMILSWTAGGDFANRANAQDSSSDAEVVALVDEIKMHYANSLQLGEKIFNECHPSGSPLPPATNPKTNCDRLYHFMSQIRAESNDHKRLNSGTTNHWDLNLCSASAVSTGSKSWPTMCEALKKLSRSQEKLRNKLSQ